MMKLWLYALFVAGIGVQTTRVQPAEIENQVKVEMRADAIRLAQSPASRLLAATDAITPSLKKAEAPKKFSVECALAVDPVQAAQYAPIVASCKCVMPPGTDCELRYTWTLDATSLGIQSADSTQYYLWSQPGDHTISVQVEAKMYQALTVVVPDPADPTKTTTAKLRVLLDMTRDNYTQAFSVNSPMPPPPPPGPGPNPDPFSDGATAPGFRVLMVYESSQMTDSTGKPLPALKAFSDSTVRAFLDAHCVLGPDSKTHEWRIWDQNVDTTNESALWQKVMSRPRASVPWILIGNGTAGFEGPPPGSPAEALALLQKYLPVSR